ncbi:hypothetical protein OIU34_24540 [Pararhizobium sp. BT-229]|uniref:hypothetical protein n=1 Tax=Pararhizobium sp. BT-229 TaxID=2986923 RepID=UPI0021F78D99|nr:hypothetical protein [Pararhizobium sp. BT-229]MCV9965070.1 hypothetical protein [Pararhizobium sp. BT-229]
MTAIILPFLPKLILVHGLKESGKSTLADHLCSTYHYTRVKMAGPLKNMLRSLLRDGGVDEPLIERYVEGDLKEVPIPQMSGRTSRQLMQTLGDEWRRMQAVDFWIDIADGKLNQIFAEGGRVVIDDIRYVNEFCRFSVYNPLTLVTTRGDRHFAPIDPNTHPGERGLPVSMFHAHLANDFETKQELWDVADGVLTAWTSYRSSLASVGAAPDQGAQRADRLAA